MKRGLLLLIALLLVSVTGAQTIYLDSTENLSPYVFGANLEHCRSTINGGLSAQMLKNRKFAGKPSAERGVALRWFGIGSKVYFMLNDYGTYTKHIGYEAMSHLISRFNELNCQFIENLVDGQTAGLGQREIYLSANKEYQLRTVTKVSRDINLKVEFTNRSGDKVYASHNLQLKPSKDWVTSEFEMTSSIKDTDACVRYTFKEKGDLLFGALSMMPKDNFHGMRKDVIEDLKAVGPTILRWPGGNFSNEYRWKDGLLPSDMRGPLCGYQPGEEQPHADGYDFHEINTDDFIALCREVGAEPLLTINAAWGSAQENADWVEYCNGSIDTEYGKKRAEAGHPEPYNVRFWSIGNEMGYNHMEGPRNSSDYKKLTVANTDSMLKVDPNLILFSSGPYPNDEWAKNVLVPFASKMKYVSVHAYTSPRNQYRSSGYNYSTEETTRKTYEAIVSHTNDFLVVAKKMRACLDNTGIKDFKISFDEWNQWFSWFRPSCVSEGIFAIRTLHMFMAESNNLNMPVVCYFQPINEGAIIVFPEYSRLTANGQMFAILKEHQGGKMCKIADNTDYSTMATLKSDTLTVTMVNYEYEKERTFNFPLKGTIIQSNLYSSEDITPHSYFNKSDLSVTQTKKNVSMTLPAHSAAIIKMKIKK